MILPTAPDRAVDASSLGRDLVAATAYALARRTVGRGPGRTAVAARRADMAPLTADRVRTVDVEAVAAWFVSQYPARSYPGAVIGSPHGASAHLAAALDLPYLPSSFDLRVAWPGGAAHDTVGALRFGTEVATRLLAANATAVSLRQVHDPGARGRRPGWPVHLVVRWLDLPAAYRSFLGRCLGPGASVLLVSDARAWPVQPLGMGVGFQVGRAASGLRPADYAAGGEVAAAMIRSAGGDPDHWDPPDDLPLRSAELGMEPAFALTTRHWARGAAATVRRVLYSRPGAWSAAVADVHRAWFTRDGPPSAHCVVECGRRIDLWNTLVRGRVPYWCENPTRDCVAGAEWWLAGSPRFRSVDVVPKCPGRPLRPHAPLSQWASVVGFGEQHGWVHHAAADAYPNGRSPPPLDLPFALGILEAGHRDSGLIVSPAA